MLDELKVLFKRDLKKLEKEIGAYRDERNLWKIEHNILNCGGNLCLHLIGNLNAFIGTELGYTGYIRQRELEFSLKNVPREEMVVLIQDTSEMIENTLTKLNDEALKKNYPIPVFGYEMTTLFFLMHLATHLTYHLGQINYHRRLLDK